MDRFARAETAERAGVSVEELVQLVEEGILTPDEEGHFSAADVSRIGLIQSFVASGIPLDDLAAALRLGTVSLAMVDSPSFGRFASFSGVTFRELSARTGVEVDLLMVIREAIGSAMPTAEDRVREDELAIVPLIEAQLQIGFKPATIERALRAIGDSLRRAAEVHAQAFHTDVILPRMPLMTGADIATIAVEFNDRLTPLIDQLLLTIYHAHQARARTGSIIGLVEQRLAQAGISTRLERPPAMCFLDITGYTRLTQERGDEAAADLAEQLGRLVERTSVQHGGRPVKWLGDGVMVHFRESGPAVLAALDMVDGVVAAGLPPAHVGLHAGPVVFQQGDFYGQTVNLASRIAEYARPGEVLVSQAVVDAAAGERVTFTEIGPVELKGVTGATRLHSAHRPG